MKKLFDFLLPYKVFLFAIGFLVNIALQYSPLARQFGEIAGNIALVVAWVMLSALALTWIDKWKPQNHGWTLFLAKNGLRAGVLLTLFIPLITFNLNLEPTITIISTRPTTYEVGKPVAVELKMSNKSGKDMKLHGHYNVLVATKGTDTWRNIEERIWASMMSRPENAYPEFTLPPSKDDPRVILDGPVLTEDHVSVLQKVDDTTVLYFLGVSTYSEWYWRPRRLEFCGSYRNDPRFMVVCAKHREWAGALKSVKPE